jgi:hypothetical protein
MRITDYKKIFRKNKITHQMFADFVGYSRERMTMILNGSSLPKKKECWLMCMAEYLIANVKSSKQK